MILKLRAQFHEVIEDAAIKQNIFYDESGICSILKIKFVFSSNGLGFEK